MAKVEIILRLLTRATAVCGLLVLLGFAVLTILDGLGRAFANYPFHFVREVGDLVAAVAAAACLPLVILESGNIALRLLEKRLPELVVRSLDSINAVIMTAILASCTWQFWLFSRNSMRNGEVTWLYEVPKYPFWFAVTLILFLAAAAQAFNLAKQISVPLAQERDR